MKIVLLFTIALLFIVCFAHEQDSKLRLIEVFPNDLKLSSYKIRTTKEKIENEWMMRTDITFADITGLVPTETPKNLVFPEKPTKQKIVEQLIKKIDKKILKSYLEKFTSFPHRRSNRVGSELSMNWIVGVIKSIISKLPSERQKLFSIHIVPIRGYVAPSIYVQMKGSSMPDISTIVGGHADDVGHEKAGADDDASGTVTILSSFEIIAKSDFIPKKSLLFMFYSAEESGLIGSRQIAQDFKSKGRKVYAVLQHDMVGYNKPGERLEGYVVTIDTNGPLTIFLKKLIKEYSGIPIQDFFRSYGSDHLSWNSAGYAASCWKEFHYSPQYHKPTDKPGHINYDLMKEFTKVAIGFAIELSSN